MELAPVANINRMLQPPDEDQSRLIVGMVRIPNGALSDFERSQIQQELTFANPDYEKAIAQGGDPHKISPTISAYREDSHLWVPRYYRNARLDALPWKYTAPPVAPLPFTLKYPPRPHQYAVANWLNSHNKDCGLRAGCGFGKTYVAFFNMARYQGGQHFVVVHSEVKLREWRKAVADHTDILERYGPDAIGHIQGDVWRWQGCPVVIVMEPTLAKRAVPLELACAPTTVTWDEVHQYTAPRMSRALGKFGGQQLLLSATPGKGVRLNLLHLHAGDNWMKAAADKCQVTVQFIKQAMPPRFHKKTWRNQKLELGGLETQAATQYYSTVYSCLCHLLGQGRRVMVVDGMTAPLHAIFRNVQSLELEGRRFQPGFVLGEDSLAKFLDYDEALQDYVNARVPAEFRGKASRTGFMAWSQAKANPLLVTGVTSKMPGGTGMDATDLDGGVIVFPVGTEDMCEQLLGRWERKADKQDPLIYVIYPDSETGIGLAHRMRQVLRGLGAIVNEVE